MNCINMRSRESIWDYVLNENGDIKELYFHQITNKET